DKNAGRRPSRGHEAGKPGRLDGNPFALDRALNRGPLFHPVEQSRPFRAFLAHVELEPPPPGEERKQVDVGDRIGVPGGPAVRQSAFNLAIEADGVDPALIAELVGAGRTFGKETLRPAKLGISHVEAARQETQPFEAPRISKSAPRRRESSLWLEARD